MPADQAPTTGAGRLALLCGDRMPDDSESVRALAGEGAVIAGDGHAPPPTGNTAAARERLAGMFPALSVETELARGPALVPTGLRGAVPVVSACLAAAPGSRLLLACPETGLHPRAQALMARLACETAARGARVTVMTHSDHIMNGVRVAVAEGVLPAAGAAEIRYYGSAGVQTIQVSPDGTLSAWPPGFFDQLERDLGRLAAAKRRNKAAGTALEPGP
jgi:hypothetical protein